MSETQKPENLASPEQVITDLGALITNKLDWCGIQQSKQEDVSNQRILCIPLLNSPLYVLLQETTPPEENQPKTYVYSELSLTRDPYNLHGFQFTEGDSNLTKVVNFAPPVTDTMNWQTRGDVDVSELDIPELKYRIDRAAEVFGKPAQPEKVSRVSRLLGRKALSETEKIDEQHAKQQARVAKGKHPLKPHQRASRALSIFIDDL